MNTKIFNTVEEVTNWVNDNTNHDFFYRGYKKLGSNSELIPSLWREKYKDYKENELLILQTLAMELRNIGKFSFTDTVSIAQHYGLPTRFLDFSYNPYIAVYFGLGRKKLNTFNICKIRKDSVLKSTTNTWGDLSQFTYQDMSVLTWHEAGNVDINAVLTESLINSNIFERYFNLFFNKQVDIVFTDHINEMNKNQQAQKGVFLAMKENATFTPIETIKFEFNDVQKNNLCEILEKMNITYSALNPGSNDISKSVNQVKEKLNM